MVLVAVTAGVGPGTRGGYGRDAVVAQGAAAPGPAPAYPGYTLVWSEEFDRDGEPDPANWTYETGFVRNQELQWYQPGNARVENGMLIIEGRRERKPNPNYQAGSTDWKRNREFAEYTSSSLTTRGRHDWQYGRIEMRARIDTRAGLWPAFWTLGTGGGWPRNGEVDIMEYYRGNLLANAAWGSAQPGRAVWNDTRTPLMAFHNPDWSRQFHVWRMDWDENRIQLFVDNQLLNEIDLTKTINEDGTNKNPFRQPHYLIVNLAIGGQGGDPSATEFPSRYEIDFIRVYQKKG
ncbi:MAG: glycoside hydrolase family 16 protein [Acidobacteriia bacterium]|nr:glycoside hydrolase family 16 protein [Terriglobia bacterium]